MGEWGRPGLDELFFSTVAQNEIVNSRPTPFPTFVNTQCVRII